MPIKERNIEDKLIDKFVALKYTYRLDIDNKAAFNHARLTDAELERQLYTRDIQK